MKEEHCKIKEKRSETRGDRVERNEDREDRRGDKRGEAELEALRTMRWRANHDGWSMARN